MSATFDIFLGTECGFVIFAVLGAGSSYFCGIEWEIVIFLLY